MVKKWIFNELFMNIVANANHNFLIHATHLNDPVDRVVKKYENHHIM